MGNKIWYYKNKDKALAYQKIYRLEKADDIKRRRESYRLNHIEQTILTATRNHARKRNLEFNLELTDILIPEYCPYLNIPIIRKYGVGRQFDAPSIDRLDSTKGYIKGNIQIISDLANRMKSNSTKEQLIIFATNVLKLHD